MYDTQKQNIYNLSSLCPTGGEVVLRSKLVDGRCRVQFPVVFVDTAVRSFPRISEKTTKIRASISLKDPQGGSTPHPIVLGP